MEVNPLVTVNAEALYFEPQTRTKFFVEDLLPQGLGVICGAAKVGKSWLMLWLCLQIADGNPVLVRQTKKADALYLCLKNTFPRIQQRLYKLTDAPPENFHFILWLIWCIVSLTVPTSSLSLHLVEYFTCFSATGNAIT